MKRKLRLGIGAAIAVAAVAAIGWAQMPEAPPTPPMAATEAARHRAWDFNLVAIDGEPLPMKKFAGKVVLLVNTASFCGFTPQYDGLQKLHDTYAGKGFTVLGIPSGDFMGQEYKNNSEIAGFCKTRGIRFPLAEKSAVVGKGAIPIYRWAAAELGGENTPKWNFHKYLIGRDGRLIAAFGTRIEPTDPKLRGAIETALRSPSAKG